MAPINDTLEILSKVNEFYDSAWNKLVLTGGIAFAIIGVVVPYFLDRHQKKVLKLSEEKLESEVNSKIEEAKKSIEEELNKKFAQKLSEFDKKLDDSKKLSIAQSFHLQGNSRFQNQNFYDALMDFINAGKNYSSCEDHFNLRRVLTSILLTLDKLTKENIDKLKNIENLDLIKILKEMESKRNTGALADSIKEIRTKLDKMNVVE